MQVVLFQVALAVNFLVKTKLSINVCVSTAASHSHWLFLSLILCVFCCCLSVFPERPLIIRQVSANPLILACQTSVFPPYLLDWWQNSTVVTDTNSLSSHISDRHSASFDNTLTVAPGNDPAGTRYTCGVRMQVQPYYEYGQPRQALRYGVCEL